MEDAAVTTGVSELSKALDMPGRQLSQFMQCNAAQVHHPAEEGHGKTAIMMAATRMGGSCARRGR